MAFVGRRFVAGQVITAQDLNRMMVAIEELAAKAETAATKAEQAAKAAVRAERGVRRITLDE